MTATDDLIAELQAALQKAVHAASSCWETPLLEPEGPPPLGREASSQDA